MKQLFPIFLIITFSCKSVPKTEYKVDKVVFVSVHCRPIVENYSDTGFGNCPEIAVMIDKDLQFLSTEGSPYSSKLSCYSGTLTTAIWDSLYNHFITGMLVDTSNYDLNKHKHRIRSDSIVDWYEGPEYILQLHLANNQEKNLYFRDYDSLQFSQLLDRLYQIRSTIQLKKINDTTLINLKEYILMPPRLVKQQVVIYKYE